MSKLSRLERLQHLNLNRILTPTLFSPGKSPHPASTELALDTVHPLWLGLSIRGLVPAGQIASFTDLLLLGDFPALADDTLAFFVMRGHQFMGVMHRADLGQ